MVLVFLVWETLGRSRESTPLIRPRSRPYWALSSSLRCFPQKALFGAVEPSEHQQLFVDCFWFSWKIVLRRES